MQQQVAFENIKEDISPDFDINVDTPKKGSLNDQKMRIKITLTN